MTPTYKVICAVILALLTPFATHGHIQSHVLLVVAIAFCVFYTIISLAIDFGNLLHDGKTARREP